MIKTLRVALIDWNQDVRFARRQILDASPKIEVVFESDGNAAQLRQLSESLVDVILIDHQLEQGSGVEAYLDLRKEYEELTDVPPAVLSSSFDLPELRLMSLAAGMHELVSVDAGSEALVRAIGSAASGESVTDIGKIAELVQVCKLQQKSDFAFNQAVMSLPARKRAHVEKLARVWPLFQSGTRPEFSLDELRSLVSPLGCLTASELVIKLFQNGFLDVS